MIEIMKYFQCDNGHVFCLPESSFIQLSEQQFEEMNCPVCDGYISEEWGSFVEKLDNKESLKRMRETK